MLHADTMTIPKDAKCGGLVSHGGWRAVCCSKPAKMEHEGKFYCGIHDPVKRRAKREAKHAAWDAEFNARMARNQAATDKQSALERDAARYRWLVENHAWDMLVFVRSTRPYTDAREVFADAIDAAMKA